jgi:hypothetical protein
VSGSVDFTDSGGDLANLTLTVLDPSGKQLSSTTSPIQGASGKTSGSISGIVQVAAATVGIYTIKVSVTDAGGSRSNELNGTFQIVAVASQAAFIADTGPSPASLTVSGSSLYWSQAAEDVLKSAPVAGGSENSMATKMMNPATVTFAGTDLIWLDDRGGVPGICTPSTHSRFVKRTTASGVTTVLASGPGCAGGTTDIVAVNDTVYWVSSTVSPNTYVLEATSLSTGATSSVTTSQVTIAAMTARGGTLYWMENFFATTSSAIRSTPGAGGPITTLASGFDSAVNSFAVDDNAVYYTTPNYPRSSPPFTEVLIAQPLGGGASTTLSSSVPTPVRIVATGSVVAWLNANGLYAIPASGGSPTLLAAIADTPADLAFDGTNLIWAGYSGSGLGIHSRLSSVPAAGGAAIVRYQGSDVPGRIAIDPAGMVTFTERSDSPGFDGSGRIARLTASNAVQTAVAGLASDSPPFVVAGSNIWVADLNRIKRIALSGGMPEVLVVDGSAIPVLASDATAIYWATSAPSAIRKIPMAGGTVTTLIDGTSLAAFAGAPGPMRVAPNGNLYWVASQNNVLSIPTANPSSTAAIIAQGLSAISDLAVDASHAYVAVPGNATILSYPLSGGSSTTFASSVGLGGPIQLALESTSLYWLAGGKISKGPAAGGTATEVMEFDGALGASSFAVDANYVYFAEPAQQEIHRSAN